MRKTTQKNKHCPLIDEKCMKSECEIYDEKLDRCAISLTAYNLYKLSATIQAQLDSANTVPDSKPEIDSEMPKGPRYSRPGR
jgi:hypothetical protein